MRSASPARCRAWQRATRHPASPKVSTAVPEPVLPVPSRLSQQGPVCLSRGSRQCLDPDGEGNYWHLVGRQQGCCSMPRTPPLRSDLAPDVHRGVWREGALEGVAPRAWVAGVLALGTGRLLPEGESWGPVSGQVSGAGQAGGVAERAREVRPPCGRRPLLLPQGAEDPWLLPSQKAPCSWWGSRSPLLSPAPSLLPTFLPACSLLRLPVRAGSAGAKAMWWPPTVRRATGGLAFCPASFPARGGPSMADAFPAVLDSQRPQRRSATPPASGACPCLPCPLRPPPPGAPAHRPGRPGPAWRGPPASPTWTSEKVLGVTRPPPTLATSSRWGHSPLPGPSHR